MIIYIFLIFSSFILSCKKDHDELHGNVLLYTNAQALLNCGSFDVEIYIDDTLEGIIKKTITQEDKNIDCSYGNSESISIIERPEGTYSFTAILSCSENLKYMGEFIVKKDSCSVVFIDLTHGE